MVIIAIIAVIALIFIVKWIGPFITYLSIGSYSNYKSVTSMPKNTEYLWFQLNGFKNINSKALDVLKDVSKCSTKTNLSYLYEIRKYVEDALCEVGANNENDFCINDVENADLFEILRVIKKSKSYLTDHYEFGCNTCGQAVVLHTWIELRIQQIESGEPIKPGDMDFIIKDVKKFR